MAIFLDELYLLTDCGIGVVLFSDPSLAKDSIHATLLLRLDAVPHPTLFSLLQQQNSDKIYISLCSTDLLEVTWHAW